MAWSEEDKRRVWRKGNIVPHYNPDLYRKDACGAWIAWEDYDNQQSLYGWQIDHAFPESRLIDVGVPKSERDDIRNLRPMNHANNNMKGADYPTYSYCSTSLDNSNIQVSGTMTVRDDLQQVIKSLYGKYFKK